MPKRLKVALLIESSRAYGRGLLRGIAAFARTHGPWSIFHQERSLGDDAPAWLRDWSGDGIIARIEGRKLADQICRLGVPTVDLRGLYDLPDIPLIETNDLSVTRLAIDHLVGRGFEHLAFCGIAGTNYSQRRLNYFRSLLNENGRTASIYEGSQRPRDRDTSTIEGKELLHEDQLARWIGALDKPVGLVACNDIRGQQILMACRQLGIAVPDEVAVIGVDDDEVLCELADPPLSSVKPDTERIGYDAAAMLMRMIAGQPQQPKTFIEPLDVVARRSTDVLAIADRDVAAALRFIHEHASDGIDVSDVLKAVPLSRSVLERRFVKLISRTPKAEINRVRLLRVKQLLVETDYTLPIVAEMAGYRHAEYMSSVFREKTGLAPGQYRREHQKRGSGNNHGRSRIIQARVV